MCMHVSLRPYVRMYMRAFMHACMYGDFLGRLAIKQC